MAMVQEGGTQVVGCMDGDSLLLNTLYVDIDIFIALLCVYVYDGCVYGLVYGCGSGISVM